MSSTSFTPEYPYDKYTHGNVVLHSKMGRRMACLYNNRLHMQTTISYAKYLYAVYLWKTKKYLIPDDLVVDHINDDKTDDRIENFQLLTVSENTAKQNAVNGRKIPLLICPICMKLFTVALGQSNFVPSKQNSIICCSMGHAQMLRSWMIPPDKRWLYANAQRVAMLREYPDKRLIVDDICNYPVWSKLWSAVIKA